MPQRTTTAPLALLSVFALSGCGVFGGGGADYRLSEQIQRIPLPAESSDAEDADEPHEESEEQGIFAPGGQGGTAAPQSLYLIANNYERLEEITGEEKPPVPDRESEEFEDQHEAYTEWSQSVHESGISEYQAQHNQALYYIGSGVTELWQEHLGADPRDMDQFVTASWRGSSVTVGELPEAVADDGMTDAEFLPDATKVGFQDQSMVVGHNVEDVNLLEPSGDTVGDIEDVMALTEAIDAEPWCSAAIIAGFPQFNPGDDSPDPLEEYTYLGFAVDEQDGDHITRVIFIHDEPEAAETNAERFEQNFEAGAAAYENYELLSTSMDGRVLTVEVQSEGSVTSLWSMAVGRFDPIFGYEED